MSEPVYSIELVVGPRGAFKTAFNFNQTVRREIEAGRMTVEQVEAIIDEVNRAFGHTETEPVEDCLCCGRLYVTDDPGDAYCDECAESGCLQVNDYMPCQVTGAYGGEMDSRDTRRIYGYYQTHFHTLTRTQQRVYLHLMYGRKLTRWYQKVPGLFPAETYLSLDSARTWRHGLR